MEVILRCPWTWQSERISPGAGEPGLEGGTSVRQRQAGLWLLGEHLDMRGHFLCLFVMLFLAGHAPGSRRVLRFQGPRLLIPGAGVFAAGLAAVTLTIRCGMCMRSLPATWQRTFPALVGEPVSLTEPQLVSTQILRESVF